MDSPHSLTPSSSTDLEFSAPLAGELDGQVALVTGAARGFGRAVALLLARAGADVAVSDLASDLPSDRFYPMSRVEQLEETAAQVGALGRRVVGIQADVTSQDDCRRMADATIEALGRIDILVANAGIWSQAKPWEFSEDEWDLTIDVNLKGAWLAAKFAIPHMIEQRHGKIVFVSSIAGLRAYNWYAPYIAAKHGVIGLMKSLALELGEYDINVNAICPCQMGRPGPDDPPDPIWERSVGHPDPTFEEFEAAVSRNNLLTSIGIPDYSEVAESVLWLVSPRARLITGHAVPVDAGWVAKRGG
jgi:NAD(P)-dependent dehydrogenase (short-subunit alcohol dehydrogenase family)